MYKIIKIIFNLTISFIVILSIFPILLFIAIAIKIESRGPVLNRTKRIGSNNKDFYLLKFRTVYVNSDEKTDLMKSLNQFTKNKYNDEELAECQFCIILNRPCSAVLVNDEEEICELLHLMIKSNIGSVSFLKDNDTPRVTRVGKLLRKTSFDELPQLYNVIKGQMPLIGTRPLPAFDRHTIINFLNKQIQTKKQNLLLQMKSLNCACVNLQRLEKDFKQDGAKSNFELSCATALFGKLKNEIVCILNELKNYHMHLENFCRNSID